MSESTGLPPLPPSTVEALGGTSSGSISTPTPHSNPLPTEFPAPEDIPPGFIYLENFLTPEEQKRALDTINAHAFTRMIHRRQQFYGAVYYHTPQSPRATLQPVDGSLATTVMGNADALEDEKKEAVPNHNIESLQWVIDKLIDYGLFERADAVDPMMEYVDDGMGALERVERRRGAGMHMDESEQRAKLREEYTRKIAKKQDNSEDQEPGKCDPELYFAPLRTFPDQILVNEYTVQQNIGTHYDDALAFGPLIVGVSLGGDSTLTLTVPECMGKSDEEIRNRIREGTWCNEDNKTKCDNRSTEKDASPEKLPNFQCGGTIPDVEDCIGKETTEQLDFPYYSRKGEPLSYLMSIRDFSRPDWEVGNGPDILSKYCRCTREEYILAKHPEKKVFLQTGEDLSPLEKQKLAKAEKKAKDRILWGSKHPELLAQAQQEATSTATAVSDVMATAATTADTTASATTAPAAAVCASTVPGTVVSDTMSNAAVTTTTVTRGGGETCVASGVAAANGGNAEVTPTEGATPQYSTETSTNTTSAEVKINSRDPVEEYLFSYEYPPETNLLPTLAHVNKCPHFYKKVQVPIKAGSVYVLAGASRYLYRHGIKKLSRSEVRKNPGYQRISMTIRSLLPGRRQVLKDSEADTSNCKYKYNSEQM